MVWSDPMFAIITFPNPHTNHVSSVYLTHPEQVLVTARFAFASELRRRPVTATHARRRRQQRPGPPDRPRRLLGLWSFHSTPRAPCRSLSAHQFPPNSCKRSGQGVGWCARARDPDARRPPRPESAHRCAGEKAMARRNSWREGNRAVK